MSNEIENMINESLQPQIRELAMNALLENASNLTLEQLSEVPESERFGSVLKGVTLQELIDASRPAKKAGRKAGGGSAPRVSAEEKEAYKQEVAKFIRKRGGEEVTASELRDAVGGSGTQLRAALHELMEEELVTYEGEARGRRYFWNG